MDGIKHWVVMPSSYFWDSEGIPENLPPRHDVRCFYNEDDAEDYLLSIQKKDTALDYMIFEAKTGVERSQKYNVFKIVDAVSF